MPLVPSGTGDDSMFAVLKRLGAGDRRPIVSGPGGRRFKSCYPDLMEREALLRDCRRAFSFAGTDFRHQGGLNNDVEASPLSGLFEVSHFSGSAHESSNTLRARLASSDWERSTTSSCSVIEASRSCTAVCFRGQRLLSDLRVDETALPVAQQGVLPFEFGLPGERYHRSVL